ncbi:MAG: hypothetical protein ACOC80_10305 [Petrotogales bacterium]
MFDNNIDICIEVASPLEETECAMYLIAELLKKNKIDMNLKIVYDYKCEEMGFYINQNYMRSTIFVNPSRCKQKGELVEGTNKEHGYPGYVTDQSVFGVTIHEFCHLLQFEIFDDILSQFAKEFPTQRLYLNDYSNNEVYDELAEIMSLYITNPFLLKTISKPHWKFCKKFFKSPVACSCKRAYDIYHAFPISVKEQLKNKWGITYNEYDEKFVRV